MISRLYPGLDQTTRWAPTAAAAPPSPIVYRRGRFNLHRGGVVSLVLVGLLISMPFLMSLLFDSLWADPVFQAMVFAFAWMVVVTPLHHELAHGLMARRAGIAVISGGYHIKGAYVVLRPPSTGVSVRGWIATLAAGVVSNLAVALAMIVGWSAVGDGWFNAAGLFVMLVATIELCVGLANAIPQPMSDGAAVAEAMRLAKSPTVI